MATGQQINSKQLYKITFSGISWQYPLLVDTKFEQKARNKCSSSCEKIIFGNAFEALSLVMLNTRLFLWNTIKIPSIVSSDLWNNFERKLEGLALDTCASFIQVHFTKCE